VKEDSRDPLNGMDRPPPRKRLSSAEVGLLEFLSRGGKRVRRRKPTVQEQPESNQAVREQVAKQEQAEQTAVA
jgi:hypothetical protein